MSIDASTMLNAARSGDRSSCRSVSRWCFWRFLQAIHNRGRDFLPCGDVFDIRPEERAVHQNYLQPMDKPVAGPNLEFSAVAANPVHSHVVLSRLALNSKSLRLRYAQEPFAFRCAFLALSRGDCLGCLPLDNPVGLVIPSERLFSPIVNPVCG